MSALTQPHLTAPEYLALERQGDQRHEYFGGEVYALAGASERHVTLVANLIHELVGQLKGRPCKAYASDMRVKVSPTGLYTYPDVVVVCGRAQFEDEQRDTLLNPTVIIEVLSDSTEAYDRGKKFEHYRALPSLTDYLLLAQEKPRIEHFTRQANQQWLLTVTYQLTERVAIHSIQCELKLADVYDKIDFPNT